MSRAGRASIMVGPMTAPIEPGSAGHMPAPEHWPGADTPEPREGTEYTQPPAERGKPGAREKERDPA